MMTDDRRRQQTPATVTRVWPTTLRVGGPVMTAGMTKSETCLSRRGCAMSSGMKSRQMCIEGMPATVSGNNSRG